MARKASLLSRATRSSTAKPKRGQKPITVKKQVTKRAVAAKPARKPVRRPAPNYTETEIVVKRAELEEVKWEIAAQKAKNEKLDEEWKKEVDGWKQEEQEAEVQLAALKEEFNNEIAAEFEKKKGFDEKIKSLKTSLVVRKDLDLVREISAHYRARTTAYRRGNDGQLPPWQVCEFCTNAFGSEGDVVPRILNCGHTMCTACTRKFVEGARIRCPIDYKKTSGRASKNFSFC